MMVERRLDAEVDESSVALRVSGAELDHLLERAAVEERHRRRVLGA